MRGWPLEVAANGPVASCSNPVARRIKAPVEVDGRQPTHRSRGLEAAIRIVDMSGGGCIGSATRAFVANSCEIS
jgi:hypothetical protein